MYRIETQAQEQKLSYEKRAVLCQRESHPVLERLYQQFVIIAQTELPQSSLARAATYALNRWQTLPRYAEPGMGHVLIDENSVERGIRPTKLGAKNWAPRCWLALSGDLFDHRPVQAPEGQPGRVPDMVLSRLPTTTSGQVDGLLPHDYAITVAA